MTTVKYPRGFIYFSCVVLSCYGIGFYHAGKNIALLLYVLAMKFLGTVGHQ